MLLFIHGLICTVLNVVSACMFVYVCVCCENNGLPALVALRVLTCLCGTVAMVATVPKHCPHVYCLSFVVV